MNGRVEAAHPIYEQHADQNRTWFITGYCPGPVPTGQDGEK